MLHWLTLCKQFFPEPRLSGTLLLVTASLSRFPCDRKKQVWWYQIMTCALRWDDNQYFWLLNLFFPVMFVNLYQTKPKCEAHQQITHWALWNTPHKMNGDSDARCTMAATWPSLQSLHPPGHVPNHKQSICSILSNFTVAHIQTFAHCTRSE